MSKLEAGTGYGFSRTSTGTNIDVFKDWQSHLPIYKTPSHPWMVTNKGLGTDGFYYFTIVPGLVNNLSPALAGTTMLMSDDPNHLNTWSFNLTTHYSYIVLQTSYDSANKKYPDDNTAHVSAIPAYPIVESLSFMPTTDDTTANLVLATAYQDPTTKVITIWQMVKQSVWTDRIKVNTLDAKYYYAGL